jgi:hypothetical protein
MIIVLETGVEAQLGEGVLSRGKEYRPSGKVIMVIIHCTASLRVMGISTLKCTMTTEEMKDPMFTGITNH